MRQINIKQLSNVLNNNEMDEIESNTNTFNYARS